MQEPLDALESRIAELRRAIRSALAAQDQDRVRELRAELRRAERSWDALVTPPDRAEEDRQGLASLLPAREQVHQALTLLGTPAAPKLIAAVHAAFFAGQLDSVPASQPAPGRGTVLPGSAGRPAVLPVPGADVGSAVGGPGLAMREYLAAGTKDHRAAQPARRFPDRRYPDRRGGSQPERDGDRISQPRGGSAAAALRHEYPCRRPGTARRQHQPRNRRCGRPGGAGHPLRPGPRRPGSGRGPRPEAAR